MWDLVNGTTGRKKNEHGNFFILMNIEIVSKDNIPDLFNQQFINLGTHPGPDTEDMSHTLV